MPRILAIDYGVKRTGLAWTDPLMLVALPLAGIETGLLLPKLKDWVPNENVECIVLGLPTRLDGRDTDATQPVLKLANELKQTFPALKIVLLDERFTTSLAQQALRTGGATLQQRRDKNLINQTAAVILLQDYLAARNS